MTRVVLVHGAIERQHGFDDVVAQLEGIDVVAYDRRGHGARWQEGSTSLSDDVDELLDLLTGRPATVVGHSLGGLIALGAALRAPERVVSVGLFETALPWAEWWTDEERATMLKEIDRNSIAARAAAPEDRARLEVAWAACRRQVVDAIDAPFRWQDAAVPVTAGCGATSVGYSARDAGVLARHYGSEPVVLAGAGHRAHRTHPEAFAGFVVACVPPPGGDALRP